MTVRMRNKDSRCAAAAAGLVLLAGCTNPAPAPVTSHASAKEPPLQWLAAEPLSPYELQRLMQQQPRCRLAGARELLAWVKRHQAAGRDLPRGLYWVQPDDASEAAFALYVLLPAAQVVDYGYLVFDAHAVVVCDQA